MKDLLSIIPAIRNQLKPKMVTFHLFSPDASRLPQRLGTCRLPNLRTTTGLDVFNCFVEQFPFRHSRKYFFLEISNILWLMVYQVWILGPGDAPTAAHELWEDDRMELLVRKFCRHFFPEWVIRSTWHLMAGFLPCHFIVTEFWHKLCWCCYLRPSEFFSHTKMIDSHIGNLDKMKNILIRWLTVAQVWFLLRTLVRSIACIITILL